MAEPRQVRGPDGELYTMPAEATDAQISAYLKAIPASNAPQAPKARTWTDVAVDALPYVGGAVGGVVGTAGGPLGTVGGATLGGAAGEAWKQNINRMRGAEAPSSATDAALAMAKEAGIQGAGAATGGLVGKAIGSAIPEAAYNLAIHPNLKQIGSTIGSIGGGAAPAVVGAMKLAQGDLMGAAYGLTAAAGGAWTGGITGWFTAKLAQKLAEPIALSGGLPKFAQALGTLGAAKAIKTLAEYGLSPSEAAQTYNNLTLQEGQK